MIINKAIKNLDLELYKNLKIAHYSLTENEVNAAMLLKCGYSSDDIQLFMGIDSHELDTLVHSTLKKLGFKNVIDLKDFLSNEKSIKKEK